MNDDNFNSKLPAIVEQESRRFNGLQPSPSYSSSSFGDPESESAAVPISHYLWILRRHFWRILAFVAACVIATFIISKRVTPIYESTASVDVDRQMPQGVMGQAELRNLPNDADQFLATQVKLIQSDAVLRPVAEKYRLLEQEQQLPKDKSQVSSVEEAPIVLKRLKVARPPNTYLLQISYRSKDPQLAADVSNAIANSFIENTFAIRFNASKHMSTLMEKQLEDLKAKMERSGAVLAQYERELNVINPEEKTSILSSRLLQLNTDYTNAQADRIRKEAAYQSVRGGTLEAAQVSTQGEALKKITERLNEAQEHFSDIKTHFGANHPEYKKAAALVSELQGQLNNTRQNIGQRVEVEYREAVDRERMLQKSVAETKTEFDKLNVRSIQYATAKREAEADRKFYEELVRKIKEGDINNMFQNNAIRMADVARPAVKPVSPNLPLNLGLALLLSTILAVGGAVLGDLLDNTVRDADYVQRALKTEVVGFLPEVKASKAAVGASPAKADSNGTMGLMRLAETSGDQRTSGYVEAVRTLRNSILLSSFDSRLNSLLVTSASPKEGKTTTAVHLAVAHAEQHHKTLLIDCDLRRPSVHRYFELTNDAGLTSVIVDGQRWQDVLVNVPTLPDLDILPSGPASRRAADLVGKPINQILQEASKKYDLVVIDAPPMLGFAESLQLATLVDGVVVVTHAGETSRNALGSVVGSLNRIKANVVGVVMNKMGNHLSDGYYYHGYYGKYGKTQYYYNSDAESTKA